MQKRVSINIKNHIADVKLNRPEKMNALDEAMFLAIIEAGEAIRKNPVSYTHLTLPTINSV